MRRRRLLAGLAAGSALAGCVAIPGRDGTRAGGRSAGDARPAPSIGSVDLPVPKDDLLVAAPTDQIPAITEPAFADDWAGVEIPGADGYVRLPSGAPVIGVERDGAARAYPLRVLNPHEVVNDSFGGPLLVTYCPICGSSVVAERLVGGEPTTFGVSGRLWRSDLVMYDRATGSLWSQIIATAIRGPRVGDRLRLVPSTLTSWGEWRESHPDTAVLLPPPHSNTVRGRDPGYLYDTGWYTDDDERQLVGLDTTEGELHQKVLVLGVTAGGVARAYPFFVVEEAGVVNDAVGGLPVAVTVTPAGALVGYDRRVAGAALAFDTAGDAHLRAGGSRWKRSSGRAVDGPHEGRTLRPATTRPPMFWHAWEGFHPGTDVYGVESGDG